MNRQEYSPAAKAFWYVIGMVGVANVWYLYGLAAAAWSNSEWLTFILLSINLITVVCLLYGALMRVEDGKPQKIENRFSKQNRAKHKEGKQ